MSADTAIDTDLEDGVPYPEGADVIRAKTSAQKPEVCRQAVHQRKKRSRWILSVTLLIVAVALGGVFHFFQFAHTVSTFERPGSVNADAIVVLTGGQARVAEAVRLLEEGHAKRLLISGVHPGTTREQIAVVTSSPMPLEKNSVDLDRVALNTAGNATETASWVRKYGFSSLLVVTSAYHLPRAETELSGALPDVNLIGYPVVSKDLDLAAWYKSLPTTKLLIREYVKYMVARLRIAMQGAG